MLMIGWTTVAEKAQAEALAKELVQSALAACVQIDGPIQSVYRWNGQVEQASEYRLTVKFMVSREPEIADFLARKHPYEVPEWVAVRSEFVAEKYLSWARANSTSAPL